jgi:hypothetical protein
MNILLLVVLSANALASSDLFARYPVTEQVTLSDGTRLGLPLHDFDSKGAVLAGLAEVNALEGILSPQQLRPLEVLPGKGLMLLFFMDYLSTGLGAYQELVVLIAATQKESAPSSPLDRLEGFAHLLAVYLPLLNGKLNASTGDYGFYTWKMWVDSEPARLAGLEVWGFPKSLAQVSNRIEPRRTTLSVREPKGSLVVSAERHGLSPPAIPLTIDLQMFTPFETLPTRTRGIAETKSLLMPFTRGDHLSFGTDSEWGRKLANTGFKPLLWQIMPRVQAVFLKPHGSRP